MRTSPLLLLLIAVAACASDRPAFNSDDPVFMPDSPSSGGDPSFQPAGKLSEGARPDFGTPVTLAKAPPPLGAATIAVTTDGQTAVATDPDRDSLVIANLETGAVRRVAFAEDAEPGRFALEEETRRVHVALRRSGEIATVDYETGIVIERRSVCASPQGIARDGSVAFVVCADGEVMNMPLALGSAALQVTRLAGGDLRDVVVLPDSSTMLVSQLRSAKIFEIAKGNGAVMASTEPSSIALRTVDGTRFADPFAAYRMVRSSSKNVMLVHQSGTRDEINVEQPNAYGGMGGGCGSAVVNTNITSFDRKPEGFNVRPGPQFQAAVAPTDIAVSPTGRVVVVAAGNGHTKLLRQIFIIQPLKAVGPLCVTNAPNQSANGDPPGQVVAATFAPNEAIVAFTREPAGIHVLSSGATKWTTFLAGGESKEDTGHAIFHSNAGAGMACVSCHPEGGDDGRVWSLSSTGPRRTQTLRGTLAGTAPYHWGGDAKDIEVSARDVFSVRMAGTALSAPQVKALEEWVTRIPAPPAARVSDLDKEAVARGKVLFESTDVGCTSCHSGTMLTNNESVAVGTGGKFQVPSLIGLRTHAPFLHDGRAATLLDRFEPAKGGGDAHGSTSALSKEAKTDLVRYLETL